MVSPGRDVFSDSEPLNNDRIPRTNGATANKGNIVIDKVNNEIGKHFSPHSFRVRVVFSSLKAFKKFELSLAIPPDYPFGVLQLQDFKSHTGETRLSESESQYSLTKERNLDLTAGLEESGISPGRDVFSDSEPLNIDRIPRTNGAIANKGNIVINKVNNEIGKHLYSTEINGRAWSGRSRYSSEIQNGRMDGSHFAESLKFKQPQTKTCESWTRFISTFHYKFGSDVMAEAVSPQDQWEEAFEDEFGEIIKTRSDVPCSIRSEFIARTNVFNSRDTGSSEALGVYTDTGNERTQLPATQKAITEETFGAFEML
ncbi:hypothetical protein DNTS_002630 [Danionella cerebrum]|uniref:Uncharacterized protein n=1 Tax=Danionella cerebrum TaxID=2873325 RepID=A0A553MVE9_9TELE|nr:hypothetical protein DNTS_002630 [Danionella translucida]